MGVRLTNMPETLYVGSIYIHLIQTHIVPPVARAARSLMSSPDTTLKL